MTRRTNARGLSEDLDEHVVVCRDATRTMRTVTAHRRLALKAGQRLLSHAHGRLLIGAAPGDVVACTPDLDRLAQFSITESTEGVAMSPSGDSVLVRQRDALTLIDLASGRPRWAVSGVFADAAFSSDGTVIWTVSTPSGFRGGCTVSQGGAPHAEVDVRSIGTGAQLASCRVPDTNGSSELVLFPHPSPSAVTLWLAAGQNGCAAFELDFLDWNVSSRTLPPSNCGPPIFAENERLYVASDDGHAFVLRYPTLLARPPVPWRTGEERFELSPDEGGQWIVAIGENIFGWLSSHGRIFMFDASSGHVLDEVAIDGHPVRPVGHYFPSLVKRPSYLATDVRAVVRCGPAHLVAQTRTELVITRTIDWYPELYDTPLFPERYARPDWAR